MNLRQERLAQERARLVALCDAQRARLSELALHLEGPVELTGSVLGFVGTLRRSPLLITAVAALLARTPWRKLARAPKWIWRVWRIAQFFRGWAR